MTTGSEGKQVPTGRAAVYHVYTKVCEKSGWQKEPGVVAEARLAEAVKTYEAKGARVEVVADHKPREVFHVYGGGCSRNWRLMGTYVSAQEACDAAREIRTVQKLRNCLVTSGDKGEGYWSLGTPTAFTVYVEGCKGRWFAAATMQDAKKAEELAAERRRGADEVEVVRRYVSR